MKNYITIIGGGLAGSEAAYQIAKAGINVKLYEMKPKKFSEAHSNKNLAEIVCSNSFKSNLLTNASTTNSFVVVDNSGLSISK